MADHGTVEYATATGNDYSAHESGYRSFVHFTVVSILFVVNICFGLATGGVMGHWFWAAAIFVVAVIGAIPGLMGGSKMPSIAAFIFGFLVFAANGLAGH